MPHVKWNVESNRITYHKDLSGLESATNSKLVAVLRQLACVVYVANRVFGDICVECRDLNSRTERLRSRLENCSVVVKSLNAKTVPVPVGDLTRVREIKQHFQTHYDKETNLFVPDTRPKCLEKLYQKATATAQLTIQPDSTYCSDTETCLTTYSDTLSRNSDADVDSRRPSSCYSKRELKTRDAIHIDDLSYFSEDEWCSKSAFQQKAWHNEELNAELLNYSSSVVPIDVTGSNFQKMSTFRRSLIHFDFLVKRKKKKKNRRNNIIVIKRDCSDAEEVCSGSKNTSIPKRTKSPNRASSCSVKLASDKTSNKNEVTDVKTKEIETVMNENSMQSNSGKIDSISRCVTNKVEKTTGSRKACGFLPISTFSAAMSVAVNLRGTSVVTKVPENSQSTNGSDRYRFTHTNSSSKSSLGKDSNVSENRPSDRSQDGTLTGYTSDSSAATNTTAPLCRQRSTSAGQSEGSFSDSSCDRLHKPLTKAELKHVTHENNHSFDMKSTRHVESQNDYQKPSTPSYETDSSASFGSIKSYSSCTSVSTIGNNSLNSILSQTYTELSSDSNSLVGISKHPPLPPYRNLNRPSNGNQQMSDGSTLPVSNLQHGLSDTAKKNFNNTKGSDAKNNYTLTNRQVSHPEEKSNEFSKSQHIKQSDSYCKPTYPHCATNYQRQDNDVYHSYQPVSNNNKPPLKTFFPLKEIPKTVKVSSCKTESVSSKSETQKQNTDASYLVPQRVQLGNEKSSVPLKYAHHITVTPIARPQKQSTTSSSGDSNLTAKNSLGVDETYFHGVHRNAKDYSSLRSRKSATRVLLDANETVVFSSNSLGRRRDGHPLNYVPSFITSEKKYATLPFSQHPNSTASHYGAYVKLSPDGRITCSNTVPRIRNNLNQNQAILHAASKQNSESNRSSNVAGHHARIISGDSSTFPPLNMDHQVESVSNNQPQVYPPCKEVIPSPVNTNHAKKSPPVNSTSTNSTCKLNKDDSTKLQHQNPNIGGKTHLTSENLFALIHSSKKRHNIKTEIDISPSLSPCSFQSKPQPTAVDNEHGFLNPGQTKEKGNSSKYQNGSVIHSPSKSTSIQEFKMLLLQTKNHNLNNSPSKSAAEQLKTTAQLQKRTCDDSHSILGPLSLCHQSTYMLPSTVPLKRGSKARASLPVRRRGYPPIWEDHSEESEADRKCSLQSAQTDPMTKSTNEITATKSPWLPPHSSSAWV